MFSLDRRERPRRFAWSSLRPSARNPFLPLARRFSRAPTIEPAASEPESETVQVYNDHPRNQPVRYIESPALSILNEALVKCTWQGGGYASSNSGSLQKYTSTVIKKTQPWETFFPAAFHRAYWAAVGSVPDLAATPQQRRHLASEGDVADVTMSNILSALPAILTPLLNFRCEGILEVAIHQHPTVKLPSATLGDTKDGPSVSSEADSTKASSVFPDHALVLTRSCAPHGNGPKSVVCLVILEEKQAGYVAPAEWQATTNRRWIQSKNIKAHLDQLIGYGILAPCSYFLLTDYLHGVGVAMKQQQMAGDLTTHVAAYPHAARLAPQRTQAVANPLDKSLRHGVCMLAVKAMYDLGVLDLTKAQDLQHVQLNDRVEELLREHKRELEHQCARDSYLAQGLQHSRSTRRRAQV